MILFELLAGELPFRGDRQMLLFQILNDEPDSPRKFNSTVSKDLETICLKCLEKEPGRRFASAQDLADELERYLQGEPIRSRATTVAERMWRRYTRDPKAPLMVAGGYCFLVGLVLTLWSLVGLVYVVIHFGSIPNASRLLAEILSFSVAVYLPTMLLGLQVLNGHRWLLWPLLLVFSFGTIATGVSTLVRNSWLNILESVNIDVVADGTRFPQIQLFARLAVLLLIGSVLQLLAILAGERVRIRR